MSAALSLSGMDGFRVFGSLSHQRVKEDWVSRDGEEEEEEERSPLSFSLKSRRLIRFSLGPSN